MGDYLIVNRAPEDEGAHRASKALADAARSDGWKIKELNSHTWLGVHGAGASRTLAVGRWILIGDVFNRRAPSLAPSSADDPWDYERKLIARFWGRFTGVLFGEKNQISALLRDPSGALECVTWTQAGLTIASSTAPDWLIARLRPEWTIDLDRLARTLRDPVPATGCLMLRGPVALEPGTLQPLPSDRPGVVLWRPVDVARRSLTDPVSLDAAAEQLRSALDEAVNGLADLGGPLAAEVSGGLDSSVVAASLARKDIDRVKLWINAYGATAEADERAYLRALGDKLGFKPLSVPHATGRISPADLEDAGQGFRPGLTGLDRAHDLDWADRMTRAGVKAVMTGKGGDSILLQRATGDVFTDLWLDRGWRSLWSADVFELAAANETSIWTMIRNARRHKRDGHAWPVRDHPLLKGVSAPPDLHPWLEDCEDFGPGKVLQIAGVADSVSRHAPSWPNEDIDVRHPLCAQPVIEACLALPTAVLTTGGRDRGLTRRAFADALPQEILDRRSKGDMTSIYGRMILNNLDVLRPWLLEGRLAALGVIDRDAVERQLAHETLVWQGRYSTIMVAAAFEGWLRAWEARLGPASYQMQEPRASERATP